MSKAESIIDGVSDNLRLFVLLGGGYVLGVEGGYIDGYPDLSALPGLPALPDWWELAVLVGLGVGLVSFVVGSKLAALLPEPDGHVVVALDATTDIGLGAWELNDVAWEQLEVKKGTLYPWQDSPLDTYEARIYNPETNVAVANWREAPPASAFLGETEQSAVRAQIEELREDYEQDARFARALRRRFSGILRRLDAQRARDQNAALEPHLSPSFGEQSIDDVIRETVPPEALPPHMQDEDDGTDDDEDGQGQGEFVGFDLLEDDDALEPVGPLANDGGTVDAE